MTIVRGEREENRMTKEQMLCGECRHHKKDADGDWYCSNPDSAYYMDWTEYSDGCEEGEER